MPTLARRWSTRRRLGSSMPAAALVSSRRVRSERSLGRGTGDFSGGGWPTLTEISRNRRFGASGCGTARWISGTRNRSLERHSGESACTSNRVALKFATRQWRATSSPTHCANCALRVFIFLTCAFNSGEVALLTIVLRRCIGLIGDRSLSWK